MGCCNVSHTVSCIRKKKLAFPNATQVVAMSKTMLSPLFAGAAIDIGFVPSVCVLALVGTNLGEVFVNAIP